MPSSTSFAVSPGSRLRSTALVPTCQITRSGFISSTATCSRFIISGASSPPWPRLTTVMSALGYCRCSCAARRRQARNAAENVAGRFRDLLDLFDRLGGETLWLRRIGLVESRNTAGRGRAGGRGSGGRRSVRFGAIGFDAVGFGAVGFGAVRERRLLVGLGARGHDLHRRQQHNRRDG